MEMRPEEFLYILRSNLIKYGKRVSIENPDKLSIAELQALLVKIFDELNKIDMAYGFEYHDIKIRRPSKISPQEQDYLFSEFLDWYNVTTLGDIVYKYVLEKYPVSKYPRILCVGDGENCHLGRKLAAQGYQVCSVDPVANKKAFQGKIPRADGRKDLKQGRTSYCKNRIS